MKPLTLVSGGIAEAALAALQFPLFLAGTLGVRAGARSDGVLFGKLTSTALDKAWADDGGVFTDETVAANSAAANDMTLLPAVPVANDAYYFGHLTKKFCAIKLQIGTQHVGLVATLEWQYYNGGAWVNLATSNFLVDDTVALTAAPGTYFVTFKPPTDWAAVNVNGTSAYYVRVIVTGFTGITSPPIGTQAWLYVLGLGAPSGNGLAIPCSGTLAKVHFSAQTLSANNNDSKFLIANITGGDSRIATFSKGQAFNSDTLSGGFTINVNDQIVIMLLQEDGATEFADVNCILELSI